MLPGQSAGTQVTLYEYDKRGLLIKEQDPSGKITTYTYDANGNLLSKTDRDGYTTTYEYDALDLVRKINYQDGKTIALTYNALGQLVEMKDWLGDTKLDLDPLGRIKKVTDFENKITEYTWTPTGQKASMVYPDGSKVQYSYDNLDRLTTVQDTFGKQTGYKYNPVDKLIEKQLPNGSKTEYQYDALSQITQLTEKNPQGGITDQYTYQYDPAGNKIKETKNKYELDEEAEPGEEQEETTYQYDALNQLTEVIQHNNQKRKYFYDSLGNRIRKEEWEGQEVKEAINYHYDSTNRLTKTNDDYENENDSYKQYSYDKRGNLLQVQSGGHIFNTYEFDAANRLVKAVNKHGDQTDYTYDGFGNRIKALIGLDHPGGDNRPEPPSNGNNNNGNGNGNDNGNGNEYSNGNSNSNSNGNSKKNYNINGNANGQAQDNSGNAYAYGLDKEKGRNPHPGWGHQYKRDFMEINYVVDITSDYNNVLMMYGDHYEIQRYTYGLDRISMDLWSLEDHDNGWIPQGSQTSLSENRERLYYLQDELGSSTKVIGEDGKTSAHYNYDEFGRPLSFKKFDQNWPGPDNTFGYTGYQYDVTAELYYAQARYYDPNAGRFISEDPWEGDIAEPNTLTPYPYVLNNPLKYIDPLGLKFAGMNNTNDLINQAFPKGSPGKKQNTNKNPISTPGPRIKNNPAPPQSANIKRRKVISYDPYHTYGDVEIIQAKLIDLGYNVGQKGADGYFGNDTDAAVKKFQYFNNLHQDGDVGDLTWAKLFDKNAKRNPIQKEIKQAVNKNVNNKNSTFNCEILESKGKNPNDIFNPDNYEFLGNGVYGIKIYKHKYNGSYFTGDLPSFNTKSSEETFWEAMEQLSTVAPLLEIGNAKSVAKSWENIDIAIEASKKNGLLKNLFKGRAKSIDINKVIDSATQAKKGGETVLGHALQKHAGRNPNIWGKVKGGSSQINETALNHLNDILKGPGEFKVFTADKGVQFLEKMLPDGRGVRLNMDGTFKGFIDQIK